MARRTSGPAARRPRAARRRVSLERGGAIRLFQADPDLAQDLPPETAAKLRRHVLADVTSIDRGRWEPELEPQDGREIFGLLILEGVLVRRVTVDGRQAAELLGEGDLIRPYQRDPGSYSGIQHTSTWTVIVPARMAVLDNDLVASLAGLPGVLPALAARAVERTRALAVRLAIAQTPNLANRLLLLLWTLADRWGRREPGGVVVGVPLPHALLADLAAARRSSVTTALGELTASGALADRAGQWVLCGDPPQPAAEPRAVA